MRNTLVLAVLVVASSPVWAQSNNTANWQRHTLPGTTASIQFPAAPMTMPGKSTALMAKTADGGYLAGVITFSHPVDLSSPQRVQRLLTVGESNQDMTQARNISLGQYPGREKEYRTQKGTYMRERIYLTEDKAYILMTGGPGQVPAGATRFLDSFQIGR